MKKPKKAITKVFDILSTVIIVLLIICVLGNFQTTILGKKYNSIFGFSLFEVETGSMEGTIEIGDWIIVKVTDDVKYDDIVTFEQNGAIITHRIVEMYGTTIVTKGDSNNAKDKPITKDNVIGKVVKILPHFGILKKTLLNEKVLIFLFLLIIAANSIFNKELMDMIKEKLKLPIKQKNPSIAEEKVKELMSSAPASSETMLLSKVDVDFGNNNVITSLKDAFDESPDDPDISISANVSEAYEEKMEIDEQEETPSINNNETPIGNLPVEDSNDIEDEESFSFDFHVDESLLKDDEKQENETVSEEEDKYLAEDEAIDENIDDFATFDIDQSKKNKSAIIRTFIQEADALDNERYSSLDKDIAIISRQLGIQQSIEIGKNEMSIVNKNIALKKCLLRRYYAILLDTYEDDPVYKSTINKFIDFYIDTVYTKQYVYKGNDISSKATDRINYFYHVQFKEAKTDSKKKVINKIYVATNAILQIEISDNNAGVISKIFGSAKLELKNPTDSKKRFIQDQTRFAAASKLFDKKTNNNKLNLEVNRIDKTDLYLTQLKVNIKFSKIFSDYIIDKTYSDHIISEDFNQVQAIMISNLISNDMLSFSPKKKYVMSFTPSLYKKSKKLSTLLKIIGDEYSQNKSFILVDKIIYGTHLKDIYNLKASGYNFIFEIPRDDIKRLDTKKLKLLASYIVILDPLYTEGQKPMDIPGFSEEQIIYTNETLVKGVDKK